MNYNFDLFLDKMLELEGGYVNDPNDAGGETNYGVTRATWDKYLEDFDVPYSSMRSMMFSDVAKIYEHYFWNEVNAKDLPSGIDIIIADTAVNSGVFRAGIILQDVLGVNRDGIIGPETIRAVNNMNTKLLLHLLYARRREYYHDIGHIRNNTRFLMGWYNRLNAVYELCHKLVY